MQFSVLPVYWVLMSVIIVFISRHCVILLTYSWSHVMVSFHLLGFVLLTLIACILGSKPTWLGVLQGKFFLLFHFTQGWIQDRQHPIFQALWAKIFLLCLSGIPHLYKVLWMDFLWFLSQVILVTISRLSVTSRWPWGKQDLQHSLTHSLRNFSFLSWDVFLYFPNSLVIYLKHACF